MHRMLRVIWVVRANFPELITVFNFDDVVVHGSN